MSEVKTLPVAIPAMNDAVAMSLKQPVDPSTLPSKPHFRIRSTGAGAYTVGIALNGHLYFYKGIEAQDAKAAAAIAWAVYKSGFKPKQLGF